MAPSSLLSVLPAAISLAFGLVALRLWHSALYRRYPLLLSYMVFLAIFSLEPVVMNTRGLTYFWAWVCAQPLLWLLEILVVRELCRVVLESYPGLVTLGRWVMYGGVVVAAFLSFLSLLPHISSTLPDRSKLLAYLLAANRGVSFGLAIFLLLMLFALSRYPVRMSRNVILNAGLFTFFFLCDSLDAILSALFDLRMNPWVTVAVMAAEIACLLLWFFRLTPGGEQAKSSWIHFGPEYEKRALEQLEALNRIVRRGP